jgi:prevent-host-death family protein
MKKAGVREIKNHLSDYLKMVKTGDSILVTERSKPIAWIVPIESTTSQKIWRLVESQSLNWDGNKPKGSIEIIKMRGIKSASQYVSEDRERER